MEDLDLESFIENIEQTAPKETGDAKFLKCQQCDTTLEEVEDVWICPNCGAQATDILQLEDTELNYDETGRALHGQRVLIGGKRIKETDYGWAWSTDDAVSHILALQVEALENAALISRVFREAVTNIWFKFWLENIAPYIKDEYDPKDLILIEATKALKLRDIEVLVKVKDRFMVPRKALASSKRISRAKGARSKPRNYYMMGMQFYDPDTCKSPSTSSSPSRSSSISLNNDGDADDINGLQSNCTSASPPLGSSNMEGVELEAHANNDQACEQNETSHPKADIGGDITTNVRTKPSPIDSITILTLNKTLAFIEAASRCIQSDDPLFAADIIRACNQRLIPFHGAQKTLPEGMKLTANDAVMFQMIRPPTPGQLTNTASLIINKLFKQQLSACFPVPDLDTLLKRFMNDLNLPNELFEIIKGRYSFMHFEPTRPMRLNKRVNKNFPQYDRYAFAVLIFHLKKLFHLGDKYVNKQSKRAKSKSERHQAIYFNFAQWLEQASVRLQVILIYDPFVLFHPLAEVKNLETTPQMLKYIEMLQNDKPHVDNQKNPRLDYDPRFRNELTEFLCNEMPKSEYSIRLHEYLSVDQELDKSADVKHPIKDALERTRSFWHEELRNNAKQYGLLTRDFSQDKILILRNLPAWTYDDDYIRRTIKKQSHIVDENWPSALKLLLLLGGFVCFCEPKDLLIELMRIETCIYPRKRPRRLQPIVVSDSETDDDDDDEDEQCQQQQQVEAQSEQPSGVERQDLPTMEVGDS